jgi:hypothetical protein
LESRTVVPVVFGFRGFLAADFLGFVLDALLVFADGLAVFAAVFEGFTCFFAMILFPGNALVGSFRIH